MRECKKVVMLDTGKADGLVEPRGMKRVEMKVRMMENQTVDS